MSDATVRVLGSGDAPAAAEVLARGFDQEPAKLALLSDPRSRRVVIEMSARNRLYDAIRRGTAHAALVGDEPVAVAVWVPPGVREVSVPGGVRAVGRLLANVTTVAPTVPHIASVIRGDVRGFLRLLLRHRGAAARASRGRTWALALLATVPEHRGKGLARAVLERQLRRCDEDGAAAWLETTDPANLPIYGRLGFEVVAHLDGPAWMPGLWMMRRAPG